MPQSPNPQGKGNLPILAALSQARAAVAHVPPKHIEQVSLELFTSLFVLESDFRFKPVPGGTYWLYQKDGRFRLSLIGPTEWGRALSGRYIGQCEMQSDMTWTLELSEEAAADEAFIQFVEEKKRDFDRAVASAASVDDLLPHHEKSMPFNQRACAFALARSLGVSMEKSGIQGLSYEQAKGLLTQE